VECSKNKVKGQEINFHQKDDIIIREEKQGADKKFFKGKRGRDYIFNRMGMLGIIGKTMEGKEQHRTNTTEKRTKKKDEQ